jgi:hypothetical protein
MPKSSDDCKYCRLIYIGNISFGGYCPCEYKRRMLNKLKIEYIIREEMFYIKNNKNNNYYKYINYEN